MTVGDWFRLFANDATLGTAPWPCRPSPDRVVATAQAAGFPVLGWTGWHVLLAAQGQAGGTGGTGGDYTADSVEGMGGWDAYAQMVVWQRAGLAPGLGATPDGLSDIRGFTVYDPSVDLIDQYDWLCKVIPFQVVEHDNDSVTVHVPAAYQQPLLRLEGGCCRAVELPEGEPWDSFEGPTPPLPPQQVNLRAPLFAEPLTPEELAEVGVWQLDGAEPEPEPVDG